jgi:DNA-binding response OmpR family regulator
MTILVIDDEEDVLKATTRYLKDAGFDVYGSLGGEKGVEDYRELVPFNKRFDCVITDYNMYDMDGVHVALAIRKIEPKQKIIIFTNSSTLAQTFHIYGLNGVKIVDKGKGAGTLLTELCALLVELQ